MSGPPDTLVQRLAHVLSASLPVSDALAVVLAFLIAGALTVAVCGVVTLALFRFTHLEK